MSVLGRTNVRKLNQNFKCEQLTLNSLDIHLYRYQRMQTNDNIPFQTNNQPYSLLERDLCHELIFFRVLIYQFS
jgi:hypothetical protein